MSKGTVLVIDDEKDLIELVRYNLERDGFDVLSASDGRSGLHLATQHLPDVVVLDVMMPGIDGLEVCRQLRADARTRLLPIIMLTARAAETDRIVGLELGADDYVTKPFSPRELVARVKAILRRAAPQQEAQVLRQGDLVVDVGRHEVSFAGRRLELTATEFRIVQFLAARPGRVVSRDDIIDGALSRDAAIFDRTIDVHITAIRRKLGDRGALIQTVRGFGYKLNDRPREAGAAEGKGISPC
ncbi:MAG: response regulator [Phycisphaerae bacterium]|nr:response regulator [Phycisphaerae bacterium]